MRTQVFVLVTLLVPAACGGAHSDSTKAEQANSSAPTPLPLRVCETRELTLDGVDMVLTANIDGTLASMTIVRAPDRDAEDKAVAEVRKLFGVPRSDTRTQTSANKWGIVGTTDLCGRPTASPTP